MCLCDGGRDHGARAEIRGSIKALISRFCKRSWMVDAASLYSSFHTTAAYRKAVVAPDPLLPARLTSLELAISTKATSSSRHFSKLA